MEQLLDPLRLPELDIDAVDALQQPVWPDQPGLRRSRRALLDSPMLVDVQEIDTLRSLLAEVAAGRAQVVQAGDCAEDPADCGRAVVNVRAGLLHLLGDEMEEIAGHPTLRVGRIAGQFAKPRSRPTETVGDEELPAYRGHLVNAPGRDAESRRPRPERLVSGYASARRSLAHLRRHNSRGDDPRRFIWTSHEALLLDYELPQVHVVAGERGTQPLLSSTHWPWVGERTRQLDGPHVRLLSRVVNPVGCKVGPTMTTQEVRDLCARLDPHREPGRLTLIARMGAENVAERLPALVEAVRAAGHPVVWLVDPMHGNTIEGPAGLKTRLTSTIGAEVTAFQEVMDASGVPAGGLHLETTPDLVTECVADADQLERVPEHYSSLCDPRLNAYQALELAGTWRH